MGKSTTFVGAWCCSTMLWLGGNGCLAQSTVLGTDINKQTSGPQPQSSSKFKLLMLEKLPAPLYVDSNVETSFRIETNPFQEAPKRSLLRQLSPPGTSLDPLSYLQTNEIINNTGVFNNVYRVNPNVTVGWSPNAKTQYFANWFYLRDSLLHSSILNSIHKQSVLAHNILLT